MGGKKRLTNDEAINVLKNTAWIGDEKQLYDLRDAVEMAVEALKRETSGDAISKQGAIDICNIVIDLWQGQLGEGALVAIKNAINNLPSVQPDIIYCKDCKDYHKIPTGEVWTCRYYRRAVMGNDFCSYAERRTDGSD